MKKCIYPLGFMLLFWCMAAEAQDYAKSDAPQSYAANYSLFKTTAYGKDWSGTGMRKDRSTTTHKKKFSFTASFEPDFINTVPPIYTYFEWGIANVSSIGLTLGASYNEENYSTYNLKTVYLDLGVRAIGYPLPIIEKITGNEINAFGFEPHAGLVFDYIGIGDSVNDEDPETYTGTEFGICFGTRWYPGDRRGFALFGEYNTNGIGNSYYSPTGGGNFNNAGSFRIGITLGR